MNIQLSAYEDVQMQYRRNVRLFIESVIDPQKINKKRLRVSSKNEYAYILCDLPLHKKNWYRRTLWNLPAYTISQILKDVVTRYTNLSDITIEYTNVYSHLLQQKKGKTWEFRKVYKYVIVVYN